MRHGEAAASGDDTESMLTEQGAGDVALVAKHLASMGLKVSRIYHSEKLRAQQTAEMVRQNLTMPKEGLRQLNGLGPNDDISSTMTIIEYSQQPIIIVGHLPHLGKLLSELVVHNQNAELVSFDAGSVVCLAKGDKRWNLRWIVHAKTLRQQREQR